MSDIDQILIEMQDIKAFILQHGSPYLTGTVDRAINRIERQKNASRKRYRFSVEELKQHLAAGRSAARIAEYHNCHPRTVWYWINKLGLPLPKRQPRRVGPKPLAISRPWCEAEDGLLRSMWFTEAPCSEIAAALTMRNRNMVIGRAHRLKLPDRPSPIKRAA